MRLYYASGKQFIIKCKEGYFIKENAGYNWQCDEGVWTTSSKCYCESRVTFSFYPKKFICMHVVHSVCLGNIKVQLND